MTDDEFLRAFLSGRLHEFHHRDHLRLTWIVITRHGAVKAPGMISSGIRQFAAHHGQGEKYHETMTRFWVDIVSHCIRAGKVRSFDHLLAEFPMLLDKSLPLRHWSKGTLFGPAARLEWVDPDILPMPA